MSRSGKPMFNDKPSSWTVWKMTFRAYVNSISRTKDHDVFPPSEALRSLEECRKKRVFVVRSGKKVRLDEDALVNHYKRCNRALFSELVQCLPMDGKAIQMVQKYDEDGDGHAALASLDKHYRGEGDEAKRRLQNKVAFMRFECPPRPITDLEDHVRAFEQAVQDLQALGEHQSENKKVTDLLRSISTSEHSGLQIIYYLLDNKTGVKFDEVKQALLRLAAKEETKNRLPVLARPQESREGELISAVKRSRPSKRKKPMMSSVKQKKKVKVTCWNCGEGHKVHDCTKPGGGASPAPDPSRWTYCPPQLRKPGAKYIRPGGSQVVGQVLSDIVSGVTATSAPKEEEAAMEEGDDLDREIESFEKFYDSLPSDSRQGASSEPVVIAGATLGDGMKKSKMKPIMVDSGAEKHCAADLPVESKDYGESGQVSCANNTLHSYGHLVNCRVQLSDASSSTILLKQAVPIPSSWHHNILSVSRSIDQGNVHIFAPPHVSTTVGSQEYTGSGMVHLPTGRFIPFVRRRGLFFLPSEPNVPTSVSNSLVRREAHQSPLSTSGAVYTSSRKPPAAKHYMDR